MTVFNRSMALGFLLATACAQAPPPALAPEIPVSVAGGAVTGAAVESNPDIVSYLGLPYAAPPTGDSRWSPPAPVVPWEGTLEATEYGSNCMQGSGRGDMDEDCLFLNVWTQREKTELQPVMVWIHGGGYTGGSGSGGSYVGTHLAERGVVAVTINYRLNVFGFMAHPELSAESPYGGSGNYGLMDAVAALEWVRDNIAEFGGDPERVTIFGESAGGGMVMSLMLVPQSEGLFHRAIGESNWVNGWDRPLRGDLPSPGSAEGTGVRVAENLGAANLAGMRAASAADVLAAHNAVEYSPYTREGHAWSPNVDGHVIPDDPWAMYESGRQHDVPLIVGMNGNEGSLFSRRMGINEVGEFEEVMRRGYPTHAEQLLEHFAVTTDDEVAAGRDHFIHDLFFAGPVRLHARAHAKVSSPAFLYHFTHVPPTAWGASMGSHHTAEIRYVFGNLTGPGSYAPPVARDGEEPSATDRMLSDAMMSYWVQFANTGNPNVEGQPEWPEYDAAADRHLVFDVEIATATGAHRVGGELFDAVEGWKRGR